MIRLALFAVLCAVLVATSAYAQSRAGDVYVGAALGMAWYPQLEDGVRDLERELQEEGPPGLSLTTSSDESAFAWNLFAGYFVNEVLAVEAGYLGSSKVSMQIDVSGTLGRWPLHFQHRYASEAVVVVWRPRTTRAREFVRQAVRQDWSPVVGR